MYHFFEEDRLSANEALELLNSYIGRQVKVIMTYQFDDDSYPNSSAAGESHSVASVMELKRVDVMGGNYFYLSDGKTEFSMRRGRLEFAFLKEYDTTLNIVGFFDQHSIRFEVRFK